MDIYNKLLMLLFRPVHVHNSKLHSSYTAISIVTVKKSKKMECDRHVARM